MKMNPGNLHPEPVFEARPEKRPIFPRPLQFVSQTLGHIIATSPTSPQKVAEEGKSSNFSKI